MIPKNLTVKNKTYQLPIFCPDATRGVVRSLDSQDLINTNVTGVIVNTWHLHQMLGSEKMAKLNGIKKFMNYDGLTISDSGGFQVFSLFQKQADFGKITNEGLITYTGKHKQHKIIFTPENSIQMQFAIGSDIMICLDDFTPVDANEKRALQSVERTTAWAKRCKIEFTKQYKLRGMTEKTRPHLYGVIQGHRDRKLRQKSAEELLAIGFDGYGLGGWLFDEAGKIDYEIMKFNAKLTPNDLPRYALGFGKPEDVLALYHMGYTIFDCVLPTRDARHGRLYKFLDHHQDFILNISPFYEYVYLDKGKNQLDQNPVDSNCTCHACQNYSKAYLHHLFKIGDSSFYRLATIHNLHFYMELIQNLT